MPHILDGKIGNCNQSDLKYTPYFIFYVKKQVIITGQASATYYD